MCNTCGCKSAETMGAETWGVQIYDTDLTLADVKKMLMGAGIKTKGSVKTVGEGYGYYFKFDSSHQSKFENAFKKYGKYGNYEYEAEEFGAELEVEIPNNGMTRGSIGHSIRKVFEKLGYHISPIPKKYKGLTYIKTNSNPVITFIYSKYREEFEKSLKELGINEINFYEVEKMPIISPNPKLVGAGFEAESFEGESPMMKHITAIGVLALAIIIGKKLKR